MGLESMTTRITTYDDYFRNQLIYKYILLFFCLKFLSIY